MLVACPENSLLDSKEFYKPVVTPFDLELAADPTRSIGLGYVTDFTQLLSGNAIFRMWRCGFMLCTRLKTFGAEVGIVRAIGIEI